MENRRNRESGSGSCMLNIWALAAAFAAGIITGIFLAFVGKSPIIGRIKGGHDDSCEDYDDLWELEDEEEELPRTNLEDIHNETESYSF